MRKPVSSPQDLPQLQRQFAKQLSSPNNVSDSVQLGGLLADSHYTPDQLINIYRNNFLISLTQVLEQLYCATKALIGDEFFTQCCRQFIHSEPLTNPHLNHYGGQFVSFLSTLKSLENMPFVWQMAQLEWHLDRISHIHHVPQFDFENLARVDEKQLLHLTFAMAKTCYLLSSEIDLIGLHKDLCASADTSAVKDNETHSDEPNYQQHSYVLIMQNSNGESALMDLTPTQWAWLRGIEQGFTLAQLCEHKDTTLEPLMAQITDWIALGCIDGFSVIPPTTH